MRTPSAPLSSAVTHYWSFQVIIGHHWSFLVTHTNSWQKAKVRRYIIWTPSTRSAARSRLIGTFITYWYYRYILRTPSTHSAGVFIGHYWSFFVTRTNSWQKANVRRYIMRTPSVPLSSTSIPSRTTTLVVPPWWDPRKAMYVSGVSCRSTAQRDDPHQSHVSLHRSNVSVNR